MRLMKGGRDGRQLSHIESAAANIEEPLQAGRESQPLSCISSSASIEEGWQCCQLQGSKRSLGQPGVLQPTLPLINTSLHAFADSQSLEGLLPDSQAALLYPAKASPLLPGSDILFVTWIAFGDLGDEGFHTHNFHQVDMR